MNFFLNLQINLIWFSLFLFLPHVFYSSLLFLCYILCFSENHLKLLLLRLLYFNFIWHPPLCVCVELVNKVLVVQSELNRPSEIRRLIGAFRSPLTARGGSVFRFLWADWGRGNSPWWSVNSSRGTWSIFSLGWYLMMLAVYLCQNTELFLVVLNSVWAGWTGSFHTIPQCHDEPSGPRRWCSEILTAGSCRRSRTLTLYTECAEPSRVWARLRMDHTDART